MANAKEISVVVPIYNEETNISTLFARLKTTLDDLRVKYEVVFVDDGSSDSSYSLLQSLFIKHPEIVRVIKLSRNFGHHIAITAGLDKCVGNYVVLMDGDLQDRPEHIKELYTKIKEGYDCVLALRKTSKHSLFKRISSALYYKLQNWLSGSELPESISLFRIMSRKFVNNFLQLREHYRFIVPLMSWMGFKQVGIYVEHDERYSGKTKYSLFRMIHLAVNGITAFSFRPLQLATYAGFTAAFASICWIAVICVRRIWFDEGVGWAATIVTILFLGGFQLMAIGLLGEYLGRTYMEDKRRPLYMVEEDLINDVSVSLPQDVSKLKLVPLS